MTDFVRAIFGTHKRTFQSSDSGAAGQINLGKTAAMRIRGGGIIADKNLRYIFRAKKMRKNITKLIIMERETKKKIQRTIKTPDEKFQLNFINLITGRNSNKSLRGEICFES